MTIYTLTPNPALDLSGHVRTLIPNEKNYVFEERRDPGGNGINAARIARRLGSRVLALGFAGGSVGDEIRGLLRKESVPARFTGIRGHTRINVTATNDSDHRQTRLTFPGPKVRPVEIGALFRQIRELRSPGILIVGGSLPAGCPEDFYRQIEAKAAKSRLGVIADVPGRFIASVIQGSSELLMIKPNELEIEEWWGRKVRTEGDLLRAARKLASKVCLVCVSLAEKGAILVTREGAWRAIAPRVRAHGTVGAGDSMVGAMAAALARAQLNRPEEIHSLFSDAAGLPEPLREMLQWGIAAGAATAEAAGTALARPEEIRRLKSKVEVALISLGA